MSKEQLAETQGPLKQQYRDDPESATVVLKADGDLDGSGIACRVQTAQAMVEGGSTRPPAAPESCSAPGTCCSRPSSPAPG